jgi:hypothetical protein
MAATSPSLLTSDRVPLFPSGAAAFARAVPAAVSGWRRLTFTDAALSAAAAARRQLPPDAVS